MREIRPSGLAGGEDAGTASFPTPILGGRYVSIRAVCSISGNSKFLVLLSGATTEDEDCRSPPARRDKCGVAACGGTPDPSLRGPSCDIPRLEASTLRASHREGYIYSVWPVMRHLLYAAVKGISDLVLWPENRQFSASFAPYNVSSETALSIKPGTSSHRFTALKVAVATLRHGAYDSSSHARPR